MFWPGFFLGVMTTVLVAVCFRWAADNAIETMDDDARGPM